MNKFFLFAFSVLLSSQVFAQEVLTLTCHDSKGEKQVEIVIDFETGESNRFVHYLSGSASVGSVYHFETEPEGMEVQGAIFEVSGIFSETSAARVSLLDPVTEVGNETLAPGIFTYLNEEQEVTSKTLSCLLKVSR